MVWFFCLEWHFGAFKLKFTIFSGEDWTEVLGKSGLISFFRKYRVFLKKKKQGHCWAKLVSDLSKNY